MSRGSIPGRSTGEIQSQTNAPTFCAGEKNMARLVRSGAFCCSPSVIERARREVQLLLQVWIHEWVSGVRLDRRSEPEVVAVLEDHSLRSVRRRWICQASRMA